MRIVRAETDEYHVGPVNKYLLEAQSPLVGAVAPDSGVHDLEAIGVPSQECMKRSRPVGASLPSPAQRIGVTDSEDPVRILRFPGWKLRSPEPLPVENPVARLRSPDEIRVVLEVAFVEQKRASLSPVCSPGTPLKLAVSGSDGSGGSGGGSTSLADGPFTVADGLLVSARLVKILERPVGQRFAPFQRPLESAIAAGYVFQFSGRSRDGPEDHPGLHLKIRG